MIFVNPHTKILPGDLNHRYEPALGPEIKLVCKILTQYLTTLNWQNLSVGVNPAPVLCSGTKLGQGKLPILFFGAPRPRRLHC